MRIHLESGRSYLLHSRGDAPSPLVVMLHGAGGTAEFAEAETGWSRLADEAGFAVAYPEAIAVRPERPSKFLTNPQEWNDGSGRGRHDDVAFLDAVLDDIAHRFSITHTFLTGFSNGAGMSFRYAAERADRVDALAAVAGHCFTDEIPSRPVPTLYLIGDADPLLPIAGGQVRTPWGRLDERPAVSATVARWTRANQDARFDVRIIPALGHHWPGGPGLLGEHWGGPVTSNLDATREIWRFFRGG